MSEPPYIRRMDAGYLGIWIGPMFSGKTTRLITKFKLNKIAEIPTLVINYAEDNRYSQINLSTHDKVEIPCVKLSNLKEIYSHLERMEYDTILINEGQFFADLYDVVKDLIENKNKNVYICGLDGDYKMQKFGQLIDLIPLANSVEKLNAICKRCKKTAAFTRRISLETAQKVIGDTDKYIPVCRKCYFIPINQEISKMPRYNA